MSTNSSPSKNTEYPFTFSQGKCWIFASEEPLDLKYLESNLIPFLATWKGENHPHIPAEFALLYGHFIVVAVEDKHLPLSGCSMDSLVRFILKWEKQDQRVLMSRKLFFNTNAAQVRSLDRFNFIQEIKLGKIGLDTFVFDPCIDRLENLDSFCQPLRLSWHREVFARELGI